MRYFLSLLFVLMFVASAGAATVCTCGPNSGTSCSSVGADSACGTGFEACCSTTEDWDSNSLPFLSVEPNFVGSISGKDLTCGSPADQCIQGATVGGRVVAALGNECTSNNRCIATQEVCNHCDADATCNALSAGATCSCTTTGCAGTCSHLPTQCDGYCLSEFDPTNLDGRRQSCDNDSGCTTAGRMLISDHSLQYCGFDGLRYALQPRKFIHYRDTNCDGSCTTASADRIGKTFEIAELETTVPATPDSNFFAVASGIITVQRAGVYAVRAGVTPEFQGSKGGGLVLRGEVEQVADACNATDTCGSSTCVYTGIGSAVFPTGGTSGPDTRQCSTATTTTCTVDGDCPGVETCTGPAGIAALYIGSATYKESSLNIGLSTTGVLVLDRCDKVRITVKSTKIDDRKGKFYWKANQSHLYMEYLGGDEND